MNDVLERQLRGTIRDLREHVDTLEETIIQLKKKLNENIGPKWESPKILRLGKNEDKILSFIYRANRRVSTQEIMDHLYDEYLDQDIPTGNIIAVYVSKMRKKLSQYGATVINLHGRGYYLPDESRKIVDSLHHLI